MLFHIAYASTATSEFGQAELLEVLKAARQKNQRLGISGVLLHHDGHFFQVIEGPHDAVQSLFQVIEKDPRHTDVVKIIEEPIFQRDFENWTMGLADVDDDMITAVDGLNDYLQHGASFARLTPGRASKLMIAFKQGRWRKSVQGVPA